MRSKIVILLFLLVQYLCCSVFQEPDLTSQLSLTVGSDLGRSGTIHTGQIHKSPDEQGGIRIIVGYIHVMKQDTDSGSSSVCSCNKGSATGGQIATQGSTRLDNLTAIFSDRTREILGQLDTDRHLIVHIEQNLSRCSTCDFSDTSTIKRIVFRLVYYFLNYALLAEFLLFSASL